MSDSIVRMLLSKFFLVTPSFVLRLVPRHLHNTRLKALTKPVKSEPTLDNSSQDEVFFSSLFQTLCDKTIKIRKLQAISNWSL